MVDSASDQDVIVEDELPELAVVEDDMQPDMQAPRRRGWGWARRTRVAANLEDIGKPFIAAIVADPSRNSRHRIAFGRAPSLELS